MGFIPPLLVMAISSFASDLPEVLWQRNYVTGYDCRFWDADATDDGGVVCVGETAGADPELTSLLLAKYSPSGLLQWQTETGWGICTSGQEILQVPGGYVVCGSIFTGTDLDGFIAMFDYFGDEVWCNRLELECDDVLYSIVPASDGGFTATGFTESSGSGAKDAWLIHTDDDGNLLWSRTFGGSGSEIAYTLIPLENGGYALAGAGEADFFIVVTNDMGYETVTRSFDNGGHEIARAMSPSGDGGFMLSGSTMDPGDYQADIWLLRANAAGDQIWTLRLTRDGNDSAWDVVETGSGGYLILGNAICSDRGDYDAMLYKVDALGNYEWCFPLGDSLVNNATSLSAAQDGSLYLVGRTELQESGPLASWVVRVKPAEGIQW